MAREAAIRTAKDFITKADFEKDLFCGRHNKLCRWSQSCEGDIYETGTRLVIHIAGSTCVAFSRRSSTKQGMTHFASMVVLLAWAKQMRLLQPHLILHECVEEIFFHTYMHTYMHVFFHTYMHTCIHTCIIHTHMFARISPSVCSATFWGTST